MALSREQILAAEDLPIESVMVPEWGGEVLVRTLTARQRDEFESSLVLGEGKKAKVDVINARARLVVATAVDASGNLLFSPGDAESLGRKSGAAINRIYEVAARLAGITDKDVEELVGNSESAPSEPSSSS